MYGHNSPNSAIPRRKHGHTWSMALFLRGTQPQSNILFIAVLLGVWDTLNYHACLSLHIFSYQTLLLYIDFKVSIHLYTTPCHDVKTLCLFIYKYFTVVRNHKKYHNNNPIFKRSRKKKGFFLSVLLLEEVKVRKFLPKMVRFIC